MIQRNTISLAALCGLLVAGGAWAVGESVSQKGKIFAPDEMSRTVGETVHIDNDDGVPHNIHVTAPDGDGRNLGLQMPGSHTAISIEKVGDYMVRCGIHPKMKLVVHAR